MSKILQISNLNELKNKLENSTADVLCLVVDATVYNLYRKEFDFLNVKGKKVHLWKSREGEATKTYEELVHTLEFFISKGINRNTHLFAIGGGACSDFAGLVASMLLRGIKWSVVPTTILSMIDASIGGKVAINSEYGKNLVGAFYLPEEVIVLPSLINTLNEDERISGLGELVKYALLDSDIHKSVMGGKKIDDLIFMCANHKSAVVTRDLKENGERKLLNLGHTIGHALELIYSLPHGKAVLWGMVVMFEIMNNKNALVKFKNIVNKLEIDMEHAPWENRIFPTKDIMAYLEKDKKVISNDRIAIINIDKNDNPVVEEIVINKIETLLNEKSDELRKFIL